MHVATRHPKRVVSMTVVSFVAASVGFAGVARADLSGTYDGQLTAGNPPNVVATSGTLSQSGNALTGTITLPLANVSLTGTYTVIGRSGLKNFWLRGTNGAGAKLLWRGTATGTGLGGRLWLRSRSARLRASMTFTTSAPPTYSGPGTGLFTTYCAPCHGADARGITGAGIDIHCMASIQPFVRNGFTGPLGTMPAFPTSVLSDANIADIQAFLSSLCPSTTGGGGGPFASNCAACHGADGSGVVGLGPNIQCNANIQPIVRNGLTGPLGTMPAFSSSALSDADIATIQTFLGGLCVATGPNLFAANCASCHGATADGLAGWPSIQCAVSSLVVNAVRNGRGNGMMPIFPSASLSNANVALISTYLGSLCSGLPLDRFESNCGTCHGTTAGGGQNANGVRGPNIRCAGSNFPEAVRQGEDGMPTFPELTTAQVTAMGTYVDTNFCPLGGGGGGGDN